MWAMDFTDLRYLLVAIEAGNLLRAGEVLGIKPSTISRRRTRLGVRMPPVGQPLQALLGCWTEQNPAVMLTLHELNDDELYEGLAGRTLDAALVTAHTLRSGANAVPIYREPV